MFRQILIDMLFGFGMLNTIHFGFYIAGANFYDIWQFRRQYKNSNYKNIDLKFGKNKKNSKLRRHYYRPLVSVIVPAHNEEYGITKTLETILASTYTNLQVIVVNDGSSDNTAKTARKFIGRLNRTANSGKVTLVNQAWAGKAAAVNNGIKNHARGQLVMTIDGDSAIAKTAIKNAVKYFENPKIVGVAANVRVMESRTILGLLQKFEHMIGYRSKKFYTLTNSEFVVGGVASTYRRRVMKSVGYYDTDTQTEDIGLSMKIVTMLGNRDYRIVYGADVVASTEGVQSYRALFKQRYRWKLGMLQNIFKYRSLLANPDKRYSRMLTYYRLPMAFFSELILLVEPLLLAYIIYLSAIYRSPAVILGAYLTVTLYVLWTLWPDEHSTNRQKIRQSAYAPIMYFFFYIMNVVQFSAVIRCIINHDQVLKRTGVNGPWISPERAGTQTVTTA